MEMENRTLSPFMQSRRDEGNMAMDGRVTENGKKKLAIIGASYLQAPLILRAKEMGLETHVFAWAAGDVGEILADRFYPISIVEKDAILAECRRIRIDGICTIASDLAAVTVGYVADRMGLAGNSPECVRKSTNKHAMRQSFGEHGDPSPRSILAERAEDLRGITLQYPVIVKPLDRSGSRGITKIDQAGFEALAEAIENAKRQGFEKKALVEEFAEGQEYSVEGLSWQGRHRILAVTKKFTTGAPHFIETGHLQPAGLSRETGEKVREAVCHALDSLDVTCGASHSELKIAEDGTIRLIEIGARMGGDFIGSDLVPLSTGVDYVGEVIRCAMGQEPVCFRNMTGKAAGAGKTAEPEKAGEAEKPGGTGKPEEPGTRGTAGKTETAEKTDQTAAVRFIFGKKDVQVLEKLKTEHPEYLIREEIQEVTDAPVTDSSTRFGYFLMVTNHAADLKPYLPEEG